MRLVVGGIKGGTGKTTLATNLAFLRASSGKKVLLVDADPQGSSSAWSAQRRALKIPTKWTTIQLDGEYLYEELIHLSDDYEDIIVDTGGRDSTNQRSALTVANTFLMPFRPKAFDVWTMGQVKKLLTQIRVINPTLQSYAVINQFETSGAKSADVDETRALISESGDIQCLPCDIGMRRSFGNAATEGLSILELDATKKPWLEKAHDEIRKLYHCIYVKNK